MTSIGCSSGIGDWLADAQSEAESYCGQWGKRATLDGTKSVGTDHIASFSCS